MTKMKALVSTNKSELFHDRNWQMGFSKAGLAIIIARKSRQNLTYSVLIYKLFITRNNINMVLMFVLMRD